MMAKKKDFSQLTSKSPVYSTIAEATAPETPETQDIQKMQEVQEVQSAQEEQTTPETRKQRKKTAAKNNVTHLNVALSADNYSYISCMARVSGESLTAFINKIIDKSRDENAELYGMALKFRDSLK